MAMFAAVRFCIAVAIGMPLFAHNATVEAASGRIQVIATVGGQPDDIAVDTRGRLVWGNLARGTLERLDGGHVTTLARGLSVPEGVVALPGGGFAVAEQGTDRVLHIAPRGVTTVIYTLRPVSGQEGVDGIGQDGRTGELLVPDSPRGTVLRMTPRGTGVHTVVRGLGRPVDAAVDRQANVLIPDEHLGTLVVVTPRAKVFRRGTLATPDDVAVDSVGRVWITTLGDGGLWVMGRHMTLRRVLSGLANPQGLTLDRCGDPIVVEQNAARIVRLLLHPQSEYCAF